ncbi:hypothetical protein BCR35DRAFT_333315 [Leucosporidium creatinivorum]|uniref:Uncharacterized protein n=1 Tax=Leucosporidium creatinivorum TaxID=106004 RepID=A0A1Y2EVB0_9BASI|nr:hypothetical protein BCR35DRAFT_333315 [Leucosporidium creatinivorum]
MSTLDRNAEVEPGSTFPSRCLAAPHSIIKARDVYFNERSSPFASKDNVRGDGVLLRPSPPNQSHTLKLRQFAYTFSASGRRSVTKIIVVYIFIEFILIEFFFIG